MVKPQNTGSQNRDYHRLLYNVNLIKQNVCSFCYNKRKRISKGAIKNVQSRETDNIGYTRRRQTKQKHNTICVGHHYTQTNT